MPRKNTQSSSLRPVFLDGFPAMDLAGHLVSFDAGADARHVQAYMAEKDFDLVGIRQDGLAAGYVRCEDLVSGTCRDYMRPFNPDEDLVPDTAL